MSRHEFFRKVSSLAIAAGLATGNLLSPAAYAGAADATSSQPPAPASSPEAVSAPPPPASAKRVAGKKPVTVFVTARRQKENAQEVPIPLTVITGDALDAAGSHRIEDIQQQLPSMNVSMLNPRQNSIAIRGLGNNPANDGLESSTGVFLDGVYLGRPGMLVFDLDDIDQFELLRGPQGTLFGKNTTGGALNITTKAPSFTPEASAEATFGNYNDREFRASVAGPIIDGKVAARLSGYRVDRDGILDNLATGDRNDGWGREGVRGQVLLKPDESLSIRVIAEYNREADPNELSSFYNAPPNAAFFPFFANLAAHGFPVITPSKNPYAFQTNANDLQSISVQQGGLTTEANWLFGDGYTLTSVTGYRFWNFSPHNDADNTNLSILEAGVQNHDQQFSEELRVASPRGGAIDYTAGLYYFWQGQHTNQYGDYANDPALVSLAFPKQFNNAHLVLDGHLRTESYAVFGQANWHATDDLTITAGIRNTLEVKTMSLFRDNAGTVLNPAVPNVDSASISPKSNNISDTIAADYRWNDDLRFYASYAHGAKAGATNNSPPNSVPLAVAPLKVYPEKADDGEIGFKSEFLNHHLQLNADAFYELIRDYQATSFFFDPSNPSLAGSVLTNVGAVHTRGFEIDAAATPLTGLTLNADTSYNNASYQSFRNGPCASEYGKLASATCDLTGRPVVGAPRWIASLSANYTRELSDTVAGYIIAEEAYRSSYYGVIDDSAYSRINGYATTNLRVGALLWDGKLDVSLWARNLFNKQYYQSMGLSSTRGAYLGVPGDPLTFGATVRVTY